MIVAFGVDPEALSLLQFDLGTRHAFHKRLLKHWRRQGVLIHPGPKLNGTGLRQAIDKLPVDIRKLWKATLTSAWRQAVTGVAELSDVQCAEDLRPFKGLLDLACLEETRATCVGLKHDESSFKVLDIAVEVCRIECVDATEAFGQADALAQSHIEPGVAVSDLWRDRFGRLARHSSHIVLVDRYAAQSHATNPAESGLRRLLVNVDREGSGVIVRLCSQLPDKTTVDAVEHSVTSVVSELRHGGIREIRVTLAPYKMFEHLAHDRYLRFDDKVVAIGVGLEVFERKVVRRRSTCQLTLHDIANRKAEERLFESVSFDRLWDLR